MLNQRRYDKEPLHPAEEEPKAADGKPLLLRVGELAQLLGISERTVFRMQSAGKLPAPVRLTGAVRWRFAEIEKWVAAGCPAINNPR